MAEVIEARFWGKVEWGDGGACWNWRGWRDAKGYGRFKLSGSSAMAHRVAYELEIGEIPAGLTLDHLCRNTGCVNPSHLEPVTSGENTRRAVPHWRRPVKTHCKWGHEFTEENTWRHKGKRQCRECFRRRAREHHARKGKPE